jgi:hypothetical protein
MTRPDLINGLFELVGSVAVWGNVHKLLADKAVRGTRWQLMVFFSSWSIWNLYYYPHLGQWLSFVGGVSLMVANVTWTALAAYYMRSR